MAAPSHEEMQKPKPGDLCLSDPGTRLAHFYEIAALVEEVNDKVEKPGGALQVKTNVVFSNLRSSGDLGPDPRHQLDGLTDADPRVAKTALMFGLALGMAEVERGWRVGGPIRRGDGRPRNSDPRTLEALHDLQEGAFEGAGGGQGDTEAISLLAMYLVILGYWHSFE